MKLGTIVELPDGRIGTVVYNSLIGVGIKWGKYNPNPIDFEGTTGNTIDEGIKEDWQWAPDALLRDPWNGCERHGFNPEDCVGDNFEILRNGLEENIPEIFPGTMDSLNKLKLSQ